MEIHKHCRAHDQYPITLHADASFKFHASIRWIYLGSWICDRHMSVANSIDTPFIALVPMIYPFHVWPAIYSPSNSPFPRSSLVFLRMISIGSITSMFTHRLSITLGELGFMLLQLFTNKHLTFFLFSSLCLMAHSCWQRFYRWRSPSRCTVSHQKAFFIAGCANAICGLRNYLYINMITIEMNRFWQWLTLTVSWFESNLDILGKTMSKLTKGFVWMDEQNPLYQEVI